MKWTTKAAIQRVLQVTPAGRSLYYLGQRYAGNLRHFTIENKARQAVTFLANLRELGEDIDGWRTVEVGTGWTPIIPLIFWANGQDSCDTFDVSPSMKPELLRQTLAQLCENPALALPPGATVERQRQIADRFLRFNNSIAVGPSPEELLAICGIHYHPGSDAAQTGLPSGSVDLVFSNVVLEHLPEPTVHELFEEARRVLRAGGYMVHLIDPSDHYSHSDHSLSAVNFLRFSEEQFARFNNSFLYQNRLRASQWRQLIEQHQFAIVLWHAVTDLDARRALASLPIDRAFSGMSEDDLCTTAIWVVARRPP